MENKSLKDKLRVIIFEAETESGKKFDLVLSVNTIDHMYETGKAVSKIYCASPESIASR